MRKKLLAGNWKMNQDKETVVNFAQNLKAKFTENKAELDILICPPFVYIPIFREITKGTLICTGAQNVSYAEKGAYTGEVSAQMLKDIDVQYCIIGHSERRQYFNETDEMLIKKIEQLYKNGLKIIFCCGEILSEREAGNAFNVVEKQVKNVLSNFSEEIMKNIVIAYEPVWAIGTGVTASPEQAQEMHSFIRQTIKNIFNEDIANQTRILYGGSVTPENAANLFAMPDIDGGLVGGASLKIDSFLKIYDNSL